MTLFQEETYPSPYYSCSNKGLQATRQKGVMKMLFSFLSTKTYTVGIQKNRLNETLLLTTETDLLTDK